MLREEQKLGMFEKRLLMAEREREREKLTGG
jgi:hypothetical protein